MKKLLLAATVLAATATFASEDLIRRGAALSPDSKKADLATVIEQPEEYAASAVIVEGVIEKACTNKGCWMQLAPEKGKTAIRVTFKDYGFFVPLDAKGMKARAEGVTKIKTLSKKEADHLAGEGAKLDRAEDGTAREVSFVASGVELRR